MLERVVGAAAVLPFVIGLVAGPAAPPAAVELTFRDPAIVESSDLVVGDGVVVTTNDSGDSGRLFVVAGSGRTVGTTTWSPAPEDVEALAPAGRSSVWVGDLGDNGASRDHVEVLRVPYGRGRRHVSPPSYSLVYPDGAQDAETLLANPRTGQLFVVSKNVFGGTLYAAPRRLSASRPNRLRAVVGSLAFATDGSFFPDGRHYVLRDYGSATVYTFPGNRRLGTFRLPDQRQGEGIAVAADGSVHVSSEGQFTDVLRVDLPPSLVRALQPPAPASQPPSQPASQAASPPAGPSRGLPASSEDARSWWPWAAGAGVVLLGFVVAVLRKLARHGSAA